MTPKRNVSKYGSGIGMGLLVSLLLTGLVAIITAYLISNETIGVQSVTYASIITYILCAAAGAIAASAKVGENRLIVCFTTGLSYFLALLCCNMLLFGQGFRDVAPGFFCVLAGSFGAALLWVKKGKTGHKKYRF